MPQHRFAEWLLIGGMTVVTFGIRFFLIAAGERIRFPRWVSGALQFVPPAVLTALIIPAVLVPPGSSRLVLFSPYVASAVVAIAAGAITRQLLITIVAGLAAFLIFHFVIGW